MIVADKFKDLASRTAGAVREISKIIREVRRVLTVRLRSLSAVFEP